MEDAACSAHAHCWRATSRMAQWPTSHSQRAVPKPEGPGRCGRTTSCESPRQVAAQDNRLQLTATGCKSLQQVANHCNRLQITATGCSTGQQVATHCNRLQITATGCKSLQQVANHCNRLQHRTTGCNSLQQVAAPRRSKAGRVGPVRSGSCSGTPGSPRTAARARASGRVRCERLTGCGVQRIHEVEPLRPVHVLKAE
jgi:hypothetical protein